MLSRLASTRLAPTRHTLWLTALQVALVLLVVVGPSLMVRNAPRNSVAASLIVNHTHDVDASAKSLMYELRNRESAALAHAFGHDSPAVRERLQESGAAIPRELQRLTLLTRDNPEQQVRIGRLAAMIEQRGITVDEILARPPGNPDPQSITWLLDRNQLRRIAGEISAAEATLLRERTQESSRMNRRSDRVAWAAMALQLLLLTAIGLVLRKRLQAQLQAQADAARSSARAQAVLETVREPMAVLDRQLHVLMHNPAFVEVFGTGGGIGMPISAFGAGTWSDPQTRQRLSDVLARNRELWDHELVHHAEDGSERFLLVNARRMQLPDRSDEVALVTANDISALKTAERQVRELNRQLQGKVDQVSEVNRELEAFSYSVSHDLRAPLRHIGGFAEKLGRHLGDNNDEKSRHYIGVITGAARRMSRLIDDLLVYSRLGRSAMRLQPVDTQSMVDETRAVLDANMAQDQPGHRIEWRIAPLPVVVGDENMLRQVWLNLLSNAVKYSARQEPSIIRIDSRRLDNGDHEFSVSDNGVGFDMAHTSKLFGVFQRLHAASEFEGTGIGLASVRRVLARHGGEIHAESRPDHGACFTFTLPASPDAPRPDPAA